MNCGRVLWCGCRGIARTGLGGGGSKSCRCRPKCWGHAPWNFHCYHVIHRAGGRGFRATPQKTRCHWAVACRGGGRGGLGPREQALEGAPAKLVGPNCKKKIRPRQISKVTSLQSAVADAGFTKRGGGGGRTPSPEGTSRVGLCGRGGVLILGGGGEGADASIGPRALETLGTPLPLGQKLMTFRQQHGSLANQQRVRSNHAGTVYG